MKLKCYYTWLNIGKRYAFCPIFNVNGCNIVKLDNESLIVGYADGAIEIQQHSSGKRFVIDKDGNVTNVFQNMGGGMRGGGMRGGDKRCGMKLSKNKNAKKCNNVIAKGSRYKKCHLHRK